MADEEGLQQELASAAEAMGRLAPDEDRFRAAFDAFRAQDGDTFQRLLQESELAARCHPVCGWFCSKECVLVCLDLCGPPPAEVPDLRQFAEAVVRITADEELVERLAEAVADRDADGFKALVEEQKLGHLCHLLCHWVCSVRCRLICQRICPPILTHRPNLVEELTRTGKALAILIKDEAVFKEAAEAMRRGDCGLLRGIIVRVGQVPFCEIICEWFCSWRCLWLCVNLCRSFPVVKIENPLREAFEFAKVTARLGADPQVLGHLAAAVEASDAKAFERLVKEHKLERFCIQLCHWICSRVCHRFCRCVCPDPFYNPLFTQVGDFGIYADINPVNGLTNTAFYGHGGPNYGFFGCMKLGGFVPKTSPAFPGMPMKYRFLYEYPANTKVKIVGNLVCQARVGTRLVLWWNGFLFVNTAQSIVVKGSGATPPLPPPPGPALPGVPWPGPPQHVIVPDPEGWVAVDQLALDGGFSGNLLGFDSTQVFPGGPSAPGVAAGTAVPVVNQKNGVDVAIIFEATRVGLPPGAPDYTNSLGKIHINNWDEVSLLNLLQFHTMGGTPCSPLSTDLDIEYTTDHQLLAAWDLQRYTAAPLPAVVLPSGVGPRGSAGTHHENIAAWPSCSYTIALHTRRSLTDGLNDDPIKTISLTFCK